MSHIGSHRRSTDFTRHVEDHYITAIKTLFGYGMFVLKPETIPNESQCHIEKYMIIIMIDVDWQICEIKYEKEGRENTNS